MKDRRIRTCLSCRLRKPQNQLLRFAVDNRGLLVLDDRRRLGGRGAYCCNETACLRAFVKNRRGLARALRKTEVRLDDGLKGVIRE